MKKNNKLFITIGIFIIIAFLSGSVLYFCVESYHSNNTIRKIKSTFSGSLDNLQDQMVSEKKENEKSKKEIVDLKSQINNLKKQISEKDKTIAELQKAPPVFGKVAYLTFDDGPSVNTMKILPILKQYDVRATFFVTGKEHPEFMKNIVADGNAIGLHCFYHGYESVYNNDDAYFKDLDKISKLVKKQVGFEPKIIRFPGGSSNLMSKQYSQGIMTRLTAEVQKRGYAYFDWNCDSGDASASNVPASSILHNIQKWSAGKNQVNILMHDSSVKNTTVEALPGIITYLRSQGFRFETLTVHTPPVHQKIAN
ncbi:MAG: hypothetical protein BGN88_02990 [Clostridiales bacterium 43-6]|nr:MAG: hypothetical protein BGN88_02990 [Clostridiales bacterium 43-6]